MRSNTPRFAIVMLLLATCACSTNGRYPSLAMRDVERVRATAQPAPGDGATPVQTLPPASADLTTRLDGLVAAAREADQRFQSQRGPAERAVVAAGATGSDSWSSASVALASLEATRSQAMIVLGDLDVLYSNARDAVPTEESPTAKAIGEARIQVGDWVSAQDAVLAQLGQRLRG